MSLAHRDFDADATSAPPSCTFTLGGRKWTCRSRDDVPFGSVQGLFGAYLSGNQAQAFVAIRPFFENVLVPEEVEDFMAMLDRPDNTLTIGKVQPLMEFVAEQVLNRPTTPVSGSAGGSKTTGRKSTAGSSSRGTPRRRSA